MINVLSYCVFEDEFNYYYYIIIIKYTTLFKYRPFPFQAKFNMYEYCTVLYLNSIPSYLICLPSSHNTAPSTLLHHHSPFLPHPSPLLHPFSPLLPHPTTYAPPPSTPHSPSPSSRAHLISAPAWSYPLSLIPHLYP